MGLAVGVLVVALLQQPPAEDGTEPAQRGRPIRERVAAGGAHAYANRHALIIGIDEYEDPTFEDLSYAVADATSVAAILIDRFGFEESNVRVLLDDAATKDAIEQGLEDWSADAERVGPDDLFILFYAGHGLTRQLGGRGERGYLTPFDARTSNGSPVWSSLLSMNDFEDVSEAIPAKHALFVLDCCFGGLAAYRLVPPRLGGLENRARQVLTAGNADQPVLDTGPGGHSAFTAALLSGLEGGADSSADGVITFGELFDFVAVSVERTTKLKQTPVQSVFPDHEGGSVALFPPDLTRAEAPYPATWHKGPRVSLEPVGPARFVPLLHEHFDMRRALNLVIFADRFYRTPANDGYNAVLDRIRQELQEVGFGTDERLLLEEYSFDREEPAWNFKSAELTLHHPDGSRETLHRAVGEEDRDRVMLPRNAPSCDVRGRVALELDAVEEGSILVTDESSRPLLLRSAQARGAGAVVSVGLQGFNALGGPQPDMIMLRTVQYGTDLPVAQISQRSLDRIRAVVESGDAIELHLRADVEFKPGPLRTLVATILGNENPEQAVVMAAHVQEPGANDNASGVAALTELARNTAHILVEGETPWPSRSLAFVWGDEFHQTQTWLEASGRQAIAGLSCDILGCSYEVTGATALLERPPDPGAVRVLPPDEHTPWGAADVSEEALQPNGLAVIARCAMIDVGMHEGGWRSADHPWEGGSDHDVFIMNGIPAVLFWHFPDYSYHTSLDRLERIDVNELRRMATVIASTALAIASPLPSDLGRYLDSIDAELELRVQAAEEAGDEDLAELWVHWSEGARAWVEDL